MELSYNHIIMLFGPTSQGNYFTSLSIPHLALVLNPAFTRHLCVDQVLIIGDGHDTCNSITVIGNPEKNGYINLYHEVDHHPNHRKTMGDSTESAFGWENNIVPYISQHPKVFQRRFIDFWTNGKSIWIRSPCP